MFLDVLLKVDLIKFWVFHNYFQTYHSFGSSFCVIFWKETRAHVGFCGMSEKILKSSTLKVLINWQLNSIHLNFYLCFIFFSSSWINKDHLCTMKIQMYQLGWAFTSNEAVIFISTKEARWRRWCLFL